MSKRVPDEQALEKITADFVGLFESTKIKNSLDLAQNIMYEAWEAKDMQKRIALAHKALSVSSDCADAYILLAEESTETLEEAQVLYTKAIEASGRALDHTAAAGDSRQRPYIRAKLGLAQCLWKLGNHDGALKNYREIIEADPGDGQGIRYVIAVCLLELGRYHELDAHLNSKGFAKDNTADWLYTRALVSFIKNGDCSEANAHLFLAFESNKHIPEYLTGKKQVPEDLPHMITIGSEEEAMCYASDYMASWRKSPEALQWLARHAAEHLKDTE